MLGFTVLLLAVAAASATNFTGVDPNTLQCDPLGQVFLLLPHYTDCSKFYMCANGKEVEFSCDPDLIFSFELQTCAWPYQAECVLRTNSDGDSMEDGSGDGIEQEEISSRNAPVQAVDSAEEREIASFTTQLNCNIADSASRSLPHKNDCQRYWKCVNGVPQALYCTDGLFFNERTEQCDYEANAKCTVAQEDELQGEFIVYK